MLYMELHSLADGAAMTDTLLNVCVIESSSVSVMLPLAEALALFVAVADALPLQVPMDEQIDARLPYTVVLSGDTVRAFNICCYV